MACNLLPQALFMVPRCPVPCSPKNLVVSQRGLLSTRFSGLNLSEKGKNWSFLVRAEVESADVEVEAESVVDAEEKPPRQTRVKLGDVMGILNRRAVEESDKERPIPDLRTGDIVEIKLEVPENKRRLSVYKGIIISRQNAGIHTTIRIRRVIAGVGVEIVFPIYSPNIKEIKVVKHRKVRRARLYYLRDKLPRLSTFK
ncbi:hypothetical protein ACJIZ3_003882 [Penstemon smallii]|uniref:Ribosomal protein L19 n=1 Tax=Penstemon smallii TaxID=265156 RepID=A0ABD3S0J2_9LAMI